MGDRPRGGEPVPEDAAGFGVPDVPVLGEALAQMLDRAHQLPPDQITQLAEDVASSSGVREVGIWVVDYALRQLLPFGRASGEAAFPLEGTVPGRCFTAGAPVELAAGDGAVLWIPLVDGVDRVGVVRFALDELDDARRGSLVRIASLLASELVTRGQYTDMIARARRASEMSLGAEVLHELLRPPSFASTTVSVSVAVAPAYTASGDAYDYAYNGDLFHCAVVDAMGHDVAASLIAHLIVVTCRWCRRRGLPLAETIATVDEAIAAQFPDGRYGTAVIGDLDLRTGRLRWSNNGHVRPLVIRDRSMFELEGATRLPLGIQRLARSGPPPPSEVALQPGDRLFFYTDGVVEARSATGEPFGIDQLQTFLHRALASGLPNSEVVRRLSNAVVDHHGGELADDATVMLVHWHPDGA